MSDNKITVTPLGQVGYKFCHCGLNFYVDPYLTNSVQDNEDESMKRLFPILMEPEEITDASFVLITHVHRDHCDPDTLLPLSIASPTACFVGPQQVIEQFQKIGISKERLMKADHKNMIKLHDSNIRIYTVPSAHPEIKMDERGNYEAVGYVLEMNGKRIYHAGDTSVDNLVIETLRNFHGIDVAFLPVNEKNFYRDKRGIIGNMSVREAFQFAEDISAKKVVPTHWDMFAENQVYREEIELIYKKISPSFTIEIYPDFL